MRDRTYRSVLAAVVRLAGLALLLIGGLFGGSGPAQGQAPDTPDVTYELRAWTVDGGGAGYVAGSGYTLGSTAGQPDAGLLSGGDSGTCCAAASGSRRAAPRPSQ